jgi:hypothetical protein
MARKRDQSRANIEDLTDAEISAAIRYLDPDSGCENGAPGDNPHPYNLPKFDHFIFRLCRLYILLHHWVY